MLKQAVPQLCHSLGKVNTPSETVHMDRCDGAHRPARWCMASALVVHGLSAFV